jgi:transketolase
MVALYFGGILRFDHKDPQHPNRDRVLVRGHLGPLRYSIFSLLGWVSEKELATYRSFGSRLQGHESMELVPGIDISPSGSLGMVLSYGVGCAFALKKQKLSSTVYTFLGDGEEQEGNVSEAARHASHLRLTNLVCIIDKNLKQLSRSTSGMDSGADLKKIWEGYGWNVKKIRNGHSISEIIRVFHEPSKPGKPTVIIANTIKGLGLQGAESHFSGYHTIGTCSKEYVTEAISRLNKKIEAAQHKGRFLPQIITSLTKQITKPPKTRPSKTNSFVANVVPGSENHFDEVLATYFRKLVSLFRRKSNIRLYVMTADWNNESVVKECHFDRQWVNYVDVGIREQHLFAMAHGISITDQSSRILIVDGDFLIYRANDQLQMIAQAGSKMIIIGTDSGICEARNGPTHQSVGQPGMLVSMPGISMLEPSDAIDFYNCFNWALTEYPGPIYIRLHSASVTRLTAEKRDLKAYIAYQPTNPCRLILIGSGLPMDGMIKLAGKIDELGTGVKVINVINARLLDRSFVELLERDLPVLAVYNGNPFVLQSAIAKAVMENEGFRPSIILGHGFTLGATGKLEDLLKHFQLDAEGIKKVVNRLFPNLIA